MSFTAANVIEESRDRHRAFTEQHTPDRLCVRFLNRLQRRLAFAIHKRSPDWDIVTENINFPLAAFDNGFDLTTLTVEMAVLVGATIQITNSNMTKPLTIVPFTNRLSPGQGPAAYREGDALKFVGQAEDWSEADSVDLYYFGEPAALTLESGTLALPDAARETCVDALSAFMAMRGPLDKTMPVSDFRADAQSSEAELLDEMGRRRRAKTFVVREEW